MVSVATECRPQYRLRYLLIVGRYVDHHSADISVDTSVDRSTDTSRSTYRPTLDRYVDRHIGWHSADMSTDTSVECRSIAQNTHDPKNVQTGLWILEFITFYQNALHSTRVHCATFLPECTAYELHKDVTPSSRVDSSEKSAMVVINYSMFSGNRYSRKNLWLAGRWIESSVLTSQGSYDDLSAKYVLCAEEMRR